MDTNETQMEVESTSSESADVTEVLQLIQKPMKNGEYWYLIDKKWFEMCKIYLNDRQQVNNPGPIDNSGMSAGMAPIAPCFECLDTYF